LDDFDSSHYTHLGAVTVFEASRQLGQVIRGHGNVNELRWFGSNFGAASHESLIFVDNHDNQRDGGLPLTSHREPTIYKSATAFNLAFDFGIPRLMSSFYFTVRDQGPPADSNLNILAPSFDADGQCNNGWVCEHRWPAIKNMVAFRNAVKGTKVENWWDGYAQIAFGRGSRGFVAINSRDNGDGMSERLQTGLSAGTYCDMATGTKVGNGCSGKSVTVGGDGFAQINIERGSPEMFLAIHVDAKL
jgi:alpha-amylase